MSRRILLAIVGSTVLAVIGFGIPLGVTVAHLYRDEGLSRLDRDAQKAITEIPPPGSGTQVPDFPLLDDGTRLTVYSATGARQVGNGPMPADSIVHRAVEQAGPVSTTSNDALVLAVPLVSEEQVFAVVRAESPRHEVTDQIYRAWLAMAGLGLLVIGVATIAGMLQSRRLSRPVRDLASAAAQLGEGDFSVRARRGGIPDIDAAADALNATARRLGDLLQRERAFSVHASHQLRTPLTGLRVQLESATLTPDRDLHEALTDAIASVDQLEQTIDDLLVLARDIGARHEPLDLEQLLDDVEQRWRAPLAEVGRSLQVRLEPDLSPTTASAAAVRQILDVLLANALEHGDGTVTLAAHSAGGGSAIDVADQGPGVDPGQEDIFAPRTDAAAARGIGLGLASSLATAEGGRLLLRGRGPNPVFRVYLPTSD
ncbi:MAG TPA: HAMP domain-containing sensor histidine kinase [Acidimicrobiales bacterium]|nr:HAMP domain-containing sensor histidine kinase [Acidimicrobiales bacterium]